MSFFAELKRRNVFRVAAAYAVVGWLTIEVASVLAPALNLPEWATSLVAFFVILGFPLALILSWAYELTPEGMKKTESVPLSQSVTRMTGRKLDFIIIAVLAVAVGFFLIERSVLNTSAPFTGAEIDPRSLDPAAQGATPVGTALVSGAAVSADEDDSDVLPNSVAVLICDNLSPDPEDAYFAAGIHEEILNQLVKLRSLNVIARTSMLQYAENPPPIPQIAEELNVGTVMECSVRYAGDAVVVTAQLIDPETNSHLWSDTYPGDMSDVSTVFAIQADIAMNIANAIGAEFSLEEQASIESVPTESSVAYTYYLRSRATANPAAWIPLLDQAIEADPNFALAYAQKAYWYSFDLVGAGGAGPDEAAEFVRLVQENGNRALELDPTLAIAQAVLAVPHYVNWRGAEAEQAFQQAIQLSPNDPQVLVLYGRFKRYRGEFDAGIELLRRAVELDPSNFSILSQLAINYRQAGYWELSSAVYRDLLDLLPASGVGINLGAATVAAVLDDRAEALRQLQIVETMQLDAFRLSQAAHVYSLIDRPEDARRLFDNLNELAREDPVGDAVWIRASMAIGDYDGALQRLEAAVENRSPTDLASLAGVAANPWNDPELDRPEFRALLDGLWN